MEIDRYCARLGDTGPRTPTLATLRRLHYAHLLAVPFENLDIGLGRPIVLDEAALFAKIVERRRGGFCYELNGLFAALLRALASRDPAGGADVQPDGRLGPNSITSPCGSSLAEPGWSESAGATASGNRSTRLAGRAARSWPSLPDRRRW
jgi:N-hydroxyarylamine O-acetyltransferase